MSSIPAMIPDFPVRAIATAPSLLSASGDPAMPDPVLRKAAEDFEAVFLGEMLRYSGLADVPEAFGGGIGEEGFSDFLVDEYARAISSQRPLGIAEQVYRALSARVGE